jgi:hypothetical protein
MDVEDFIASIQGGEHTLQPADPEGAHALGDGAGPETEWHVIIVLEDFMEDGSTTVSTYDGVLTLPDRLTHKQKTDSVRCWVASHYRAKGFDHVPSFSASVMNLILEPNLP